MVFPTETITSLAAPLLEAVARLFCRPCYEDIQNSIQVLSKPESLLGYLQQLSDMANRIKAMSRSDEIDTWISKADKILQECNSSNLNEDLQCCCISGDARLRCKLQKKIKKMIVRGNTIITRANLLPKSVERIYGVPNIEDDTTAGRNLERVMDMLKDNNVWGIGVWGPGGVGKTTLANVLNNRLQGSSFFSLVIFIPLTKDVDQKDVQKAIAQRLGQKVEEGMSLSSVAEQIHNRLQREKFLLIVDNVWKSIDLPSMGIPQKRAGSKLVLTTRLQEVCTEMETIQFAIGYLTDDEAWRLFVQKAGDVAEREDIIPLAKVVCRECGHLPLALVAVGSTMKGKTDVSLWQSAISKLQRSVPISGFESQVYNPLKLSYDWLENDTLRSCFLYCSLYPEGYTIGVTELIQCWLAEKVLDEQLYYKNAFCEGLDLISKLINSCLLENCSYYSDITRVKMHDVVRDFARWMGESNDRSISFSGHGISRDPTVILPEEVNNMLEWISVVDNKQIELPQHGKDFPRVTTLLLRGTNKHEIEVSHEFLKGFQSLRVLNTRHLQSYPGSFLCHPELRVLILRQCHHVEEIPCMPELLILDLSRCSLRKIPTGVRQLTHLKVLNLLETQSVKNVKVDIISNLNFLEVLEMRGSGYKWPTKRKSNSEEATLQDLSGLKELRSVYLDLADVDCTYEDCNWMESLENFAYNCGYGTEISAHAILWRIKEGRQIFIEGVECIEVGSFILHAEFLTLWSIQNVNNIFYNFNSIDQSTSKLKKLEMFYCSFSEELTRPATNYIALLNLETLCIRYKDQLSFSQTANALRTTFPKLRLLEVRYFNVGDVEEKEKLRNLFSSNDSHVELPRVEEICLEGCENMTEVFYYGPAINQAVAPNLKTLSLFHMTSLQRLCSYELIEQWQSLETLIVRKCPYLKKLPRMPSIKKIIGEEEWWNNIEWDSLETKTYMEKSFKPRG